MPAHLLYPSLSLFFLSPSPSTRLLFFLPSSSSSIGSVLSRRMRTSGDAAASHRALHGMHYGTSEQRLCRKNCGHARRTRSVNRLPPLSPSIPFTAEQCFPIYYTPESFRASAVIELVIVWYSRQETCIISLFSNIVFGGSFAPVCCVCIPVHQFIHRLMYYISAVQERDARTYFKV